MNKKYLLNFSVALLALALLPHLLTAQAVKKVENVKSGETYYVLKSDKVTKHGPYQARHAWGGKLLAEGNYKNGQQDSVWTYYDNKGELEQKYDYTKKELVYFRPEDEAWKEYKTVNAGDSAAIERPPLLIGGSGLINKVFRTSLRYPVEARENGISGKVLVKFTVNKEGKVVNEHIAQSVGYGCDEEAMRAAMKLAPYWLPALANGQPVDVYITLPISFQLSE